MNDYGKRECLVCNKQFSPAWPSQICCGPDCMKTRLKERKRLEWHRRQAKTVSDMDWLNCQLEDALSRLQNRKFKYPHVCAHCGKPFRSAKETDRYCSGECSYRAVMGK